MGGIASLAFPASPMGPAATAVRYGIGAFLSGLRSMLSSEWASIVTSEVACAATALLVWDVLINLDREVNIPGSYASLQLSFADPVLCA